MVLAIGSNDFAVASESVVEVRELADSSSLRSAGAAFDEAWSETLRRKQKPCGRAVGTNARGNDLARYLDDSLAAIVVYRGRCRCRLVQDWASQKLFSGSETSSSGHDHVVNTKLPEGSGGNLRQRTKAPQREKAAGGSTCDQLQSSPHHIQQARHP